MSIKSISKPFIIAVVSTALSGSLGNYIWQEEHRPAILEIYVFALNSGRSIFIRTPDDKRILIDGGSNSEVIKYLSTILPFYSRRIDIVVATNTESKNVSGLVDIIERYKVDQVYIPKLTLENLNLASSTDQIYATFIDTISRENIGNREVSAGMDISPDSKIGIKALFPAEAKKFVYSKASSPEILFNISYGIRSVLFLGSASVKVQKYVASSTFLARNKTDVLVVSQSALPANIAKQLIEVTHPDYLVYSKTVSSKSSIKPNIKKPIEDPLQYLKDKNRLNLKEKGAIKIISDGTSITVEEFK